MPDVIVKPLTVKIDPGSKETGLVLVDPDNRATGVLDIKTFAGKISASFKNYTLIQRGGVYAYTF